MALREFADAGGRLWTVWEVQPQHVEAFHPRVDPHSTVRPTHRGGWLAFDCPALAQRRRLAPIPEQWPHLADEELVQLCERAEVAPRSKRLIE